MSGARSLPAVAGRGKEFALIHFTSVTTGAQLTTLPHRWSVLADAEKVARSIDARLDPTVILVDKPRAGACT